MEDLLQNIILETQDPEIKEIAESISNLNLTPEEMEKNLITANKFIIEERNDKEN